MQSISGDEIQIVPMDSIESLERLANAVYNDVSTEITPETVNFNLYTMFYCGYEAIVDGLPCAWSFSTLAGGIFSLDGYNAGVSIFVASKMGKMICDDLFQEHGVETILSAHKTKFRYVTALIRRIGFKQLLQAEDKTIFYKVKSWEQTY